MSNDPGKKLVNQGVKALAADILKDCDEDRYPERIDWLAGRLAKDREYTLAPGRKNPYLLEPFNFDTVIKRAYLEGIRHLTGENQHANSLPRSFPIGDIIYEYAGLINGLERVGQSEVDPGEVLGRLVVRELQRSTVDDTAQVAQSLRPDTRTPRELVEQLCALPELAREVESVINSTGDARSLPARLGSVTLATRLWPHQREAIRNWLRQDGAGYVNMATATGKTVLGLAAVGYCAESGSLHPADEDWLREEFEGTLPEVKNPTSDDVLIVTTDDLLGVQWGRLFQEHCHVPREYTKVVENSINLPWGTIDIRSARALRNVDPKDYCLVIFDEVHNYSKGAGWGKHLLRFINARCPVLALTGSETEELKNLVSRSDTKFENVFTYRHEQALTDGVIPDFDWTLEFVPINAEESSTLKKLVETAQLSSNAVEYDSDAIRLQDDALADIDPELKPALSESYESPARLAHTIMNVEEGRGGPTPTLERLASGLSNRQTHWWNLRPDLSSVTNLVAGAMNDERPCLILTRSYAEAQELFKQLYGEVGAERIVVLDQDKDAAAQEAQITRFDELETRRKVLVGPGKRLGTGIDIKTIEIGINLARPGTGMNASLIQRLGRLLRKSEGKEAVSFYHVLGLPRTDAIVPTDGEGFVRNVCEFFAQVNVPGTEGMVKVPSVSVADGVADSIVKLESSGADTLATTQQMGRFERAYVNAVSSSEILSEPVVSTRWYGDLLPAGKNEIEEERTSQRPEEKPTDPTDQQEESSSTDDDAPSGMVVRLGTNEKQSSRLEIAVRSPTGEPLSNVFVSLSAQTVGAFGQTGEQEPVIFDEIPFGRYTVAAHHPEYSPRTTEVEADVKKTRLSIRLRDSA